MTPEDTGLLRCAVRVKGDSGFLFINNFQDHLMLPDRKNETIRLVLHEEVLELQLDIASGENAILPINLRVGDALLKTATVQPITRMVLENEQCTFFLIPKGMQPVMRFAASSVNAV